MELIDTISLQGIYDICLQEYKVVFSGSSDTFIKYLLALHKFHNDKYRNHLVKLGNYQLNGENNLFSQILFDVVDSLNDNWNLKEEYIPVDQINKDKILSLNSLCDLLEMNINDAIKILHIEHSNKINCSISYDGIYIRFGPEIATRKGMSLNAKDVILICEKHNNRQKVFNLIRNGLYFEKLDPLCNHLLESIKRTNILSRVTYRRLFNNISTSLLNKNIEPSGQNIVSEKPNVANEATIIYYLDKFIELTKKAYCFQAAQIIGEKLIEALSELSITTIPYSKTLTNNYINNNFVQYKSRPKLLMGSQGVRQKTELDHLSEFDYNTYNDGSFGDNNYSENGRYVSGASFDRMDDESSS